MLGERLGRVDVRRHRTRIGLVSPAFADLLRPEVTALDAVMSAREAALETWWHAYGDDDRAHARDLLARMGAGALADRAFGTLSSGERQRRAARPVAVGRPRARAPRRADRRPRPRRPRGPRGAARRPRRRPEHPADRPRHPPRRGDPARLHPRPAAAGRSGRRRRTDRRDPHRPGAVRGVRPRPRARPPRRAVRGAAPPRSPRWAADAPVRDRRRSAAVDQREQAEAASGRSRRPGGARRAARRASPRSAGAPGGGCRHRPRRPSPRGPRASGAGRRARPARSAPAVARGTCGPCAGASTWPAGRAGPGGRPTTPGRRRRGAGRPASPGARCRATADSGRGRPPMRTARRGCTGPRGRR